MPKYSRALFIFRQDLRTHDNTGLIEAMQNSVEVFPIFIHDTRAIEDFGESDVRFGFIRECLEYIDEELRLSGGTLTVYRGNPEDTVKKLIEKYSIDAVYLNRSYSPHGKTRDEHIEGLCDTRGIAYHSYQDFLLVEPHECEQRKVFTPFSMLWKKFLLTHPERLEVRSFDGKMTKWFVPEDRKHIRDIIRAPYHPYWTVKFGRERMERDFSHYDDLRNLPAIDGSTRLSPYIRFGVFSVREIYAKFVFESSPPEKGELEGVTQKGIPNNVTHPNPSFASLATKSADSQTFSGRGGALLSELIWREFWYHIAYYFPFTYSLEFQERRRLIEWNKDEKSMLWKKFENAETGYPLVDAAILQLYKTNWMHNRLRMVVASFLTKNLGIDWRIGEKWFKKYLIDYDEAVNYGNWQWSASVGADPKPVRIFNPLLQSERFDPECKFIKKYLPELEGIDPKRIHTLDLKGVYIGPIMDQKESAAEARERYKGS